MSYYVRAEGLIWTNNFYAPSRRVVSMFALLLMKVSHLSFYESSNQNNKDKSYYISPRVDYEPKRVDLVTREGTALILIL